MYINKTENIKNALKVDLLQKLILLKNNNFFTNPKADCENLTKLLNPKYYGFEIKAAWNTEDIPF